MISSKYELFTNLRTTNSLIVQLFNCSIICHSAVLWLLLPTADCLLPILNCTAQEKSEVIKYARTVVDTLASPSMHGRGYVMKGDSIAADYIKKEFEKFGLKPIGKEFYQRFAFPVNTFPGKMSLKFDDKKLIPGKDFIIDANSESRSGSKKVIFCDKSSIKNKSFGNISEKQICSSALVINDSAFNKVDFDIVKKKTLSCNDFIESFDIKNKLTFDFSYESYGCGFYFSKKSFPENSNRVSYEVESKFLSDYQSQNVIGYIKGTEYPDSFIVFTAHYDHLGMMGKDVYFPGANDNASGCAMLLTLAKYYSVHPPKYSIAFMAFGAEEIGLIGSKYYIENQLFPVNQIKFLINFDIVGTGDEGIKVVNATEHKKEFDELVKINAEKNLLPSIQPRGKAGISDHYFFEEAGVKTFYIYTLGGIKAYHDIYDRAETLPLTKFEELYKLVIDFSDTLQK